jgi:hypothetical protein
MNATPRRFLACLVPLLALACCTLAGHDVAAQAGKDKPLVKSFHLQYLSAVEAERMLSTLFKDRLGPKGTLVLATDQQTNALVVKGSPDDVFDIAKVLQEIDVPRAGELRADLQVRVFWFVGVTKDDPAPKLDKEFQEIELELHKLGLTRPFLFAHVTTITTLGTTFEVSGQVLADGKRQLAVSGSVSDTGSGPRMRVEITVSDPTTGKLAGSVKTSFALTPGRMTVVGTVPTDLATSAFVVHVTGRAAPEKKVRLNLKGKNWTDALKWVSDQTGLPVVSTFVPKGIVQFQLAQGAEYTVEEVFDLLNEMLLENKYLLLRTDRSLRIVPADEKIDPKWVPHVQLADLESLGKTELVQVVVPLKSLAAEKVAPSVKKLLGPFGEIVVMPEGNHLVLQDTAGNLRGVVKLLREIDKDKAPGKGKVFSIPEGPWKDVFLWLHKESGMPIVAPIIPKGEFKLPAGAKPPTTIDDVIDLLNDVLVEQKFVIIRRQVTMTVADLSDLPDPGGRISVVTVADLEQMSKYEYVKILVQLKKDSKVEEIAPAIKKLMGPLNQVIALEESNQIVLIDRVGNLRTLCKHLEQVGIITKK